MAGYGPPPKPEWARARRNRDPFAAQVIEIEPSSQPELPATIKWPQRTREWWAMWGRSPLTKEFTENDWNELLDTAVLHAAYWSGKLGVAGELRLRVAKFGATPEDRARLRIAFSLPRPEPPMIAAPNFKQQQERRRRPFGPSGELDD